MKEFEQGKIIYCVERDCGTPIQVDERMVLAKVEDAYITIRPIDEYKDGNYKNLKETVDACIEKTDETHFCGVFFVSEQDCFETKEEAIENIEDTETIPLF